MNKFLIVNFGSKYFDKIVEYFEKKSLCYAKLKFQDVSEDLCEYKGVVFSGGPYSAYKPNSPTVSKNILEKNIPVLGICYGMQLIAHLFGCKVARAEKEEQVLTKIKFEKSMLFDEVYTENFVEMRHCDRVYELPNGFRKTAWTVDCPIAAMENEEKKIYATQFHPEIGGCGEKILDNFIYKICK